MAFLAPGEVADGMHLQHEAEVKAGRPERPAIDTPNSHRGAPSAPDGCGARPASTALAIDISFRRSSEFAFRL